MSFRIVVIGGVATYATMWLVSVLVSWPLIHQGVLDELYKAHAMFWRPELVQDTPDLNALLPRWLLSGGSYSLVFSGLFAWVRPVFRGPGWVQGFQFGLALFFYSCTLFLGWSVLFNLPDEMWLWWALDGLAYCVACGSVLGWVAQKVAPLPRS